jgi:hypothetical protein
MATLASEGSNWDNIDMEDGELKQSVLVSNGAEMFTKKTSLSSAQSVQAHMLMESRGEAPVHPDNSPCLRYESGRRTRDRCVSHGKGCPSLTKHACHSQQSAQG